MKIKVFEAFAGIGCQREGFEMLQEDFPGDVQFEFVGISEIDTHAVISYNAAHGATPNFGDISKIDWSQVPDFDLFTWSFPCFIAGTLIHTERGYIPIEKVTTSDKVLTHTNQYQRVLAVGNRPDAPIIKVRGMCFKDIICTPNHPFYVRKRYKEWNNSIRRWVRKFTAPEWVAAENLTRDHYIGYAINTKSEFPKWEGVIATRWKNQQNRLSALFLNPQFWYLMGRYVGDGWRRTNKTGNGIVICCSERNEHLLKRACESLGFAPTIDRARTVTKYIISSNELYAFVDRYGYKAHGKRIDEETINLPIGQLKAFVGGYIDSDGCFTENEFKATSVSEELMYGIQQCITKAYQCPVRMYWCKRRETTVIEGRTVNQRDSYSIAWHTDKRKQDKAFCEGNYVWFPFKEVVRLDKTAIVYNMEVEADNSYTANGAIVHNCTDISNAGKQGGLSKESGTRSSLAWEAIRAIKEKRPKYALMENVKALTQKKFAEDFSQLRKEIEELGYVNFYAVLNAKDYGVAQNRERVFMWSILRTPGDTEPIYNFPAKIPLTKCVEDYMEPAEEIDESYFISQDRVTNKVLSDILDQPNVRAEMEKLYHEEWSKTQPAEILSYHFVSLQWLRYEAGHENLSPHFNVYKAVFSTKEGLREEEIKVDTWYHTPDMYRDDIREGIKFLTYGSIDNIDELEYAIYQDLVSNRH